MDLRSLRCGMTLGPDGTLEFHFIERGQIVPKARAEKIMRKLIARGLFPSDAELAELKKRMITRDSTTFDKLRHDPDSLRIARISL